jgi:protease I
MKHRKVLIISADRFEDTELLVPLYRLLEAGADVKVASTGKAPIKGKHGYEVAVDLKVEDVDPADYDALILPGGKAPAAIRDDPKVQYVVRHFFENDKPVGAICHGPQILISAGIIKGRHATCFRSVVDELKEAGAHYEDEEVVVDDNLVTSRQPSDLPAFMREFVKKFS